MKKLFGRKSFYITLSAILVLICGAFFSSDFFQKAILSRIDISDMVSLGSVSKYVDASQEHLESNVHSKIYNDNLSVHFLSVGKADCAYIKCKDVNILIDAADKEPAGVVYEYLKRQKVEKLDMVFMSHPHRDHIGQMARVIRDFKVDKFVEAGTPKSIIPTTWTYEKMLKALIDKKVPVESVSAGKKFKIGDLKIYILGPVRVNKENLNDNSIVMKITYKNVSFLFTGDASRAEENDIIKHYGLIELRDNKIKNNLSLKYKIYEKTRRFKNSEKNINKKQNPLKANVLKVGHHGSNSSSTDKFLKLVSPDYAVVSTASKKSMGLPSGWRWRAGERLQKHCVKIYKTYKSGNIIFLTDGKTVKVETEK